jgi:hypothetical protein
MASAAQINEQELVEADAKFKKVRRRKRCSWSLGPCYQALLIAD